MNQARSQQRRKDPFEVTHTVNIEAGDSILDGLGEDPELGNVNGVNQVDGDRMVIHQRVTYEVREYEGTLEQIDEARHERG